MSYGPQASDTTEDARSVGRRSFVRKVGALSVTGALASALSGSASARTSQIEPQRSEDNVEVYRITVGGQTTPVRVIRDGPMSGEAQVKMDGEWKDVVQKFEGFIDVDAEYAGVKFDVTENIETLGKLTAAALIMGIAAALPTEGMSAFIAGAATTLAVGLMSNFANIDQFTVGVRWWQIMNTTYHVATVDKGYNESVGGTIPVTKPKQGTVLGG